MDHMGSWLKFLILPIEPQNVAAIFADIAIAAGIYPVQIKQSHHASIELGFAMPKFLAAADWADQPVSCTLLLGGFFLLRHVPPSLVLGNF